MLAQSIRSLKAALAFLFAATLFTAESQELHAGDSNPLPVQVTINADSSVRIVGSFAATRSGFNPGFLTCYLYSGGARTLYCFARDGAGRAGGCGVNNPPVEMINAVLLAEDYGQLIVYWNAAGECTLMIGGKLSDQLP